MALTRATDVQGDEWVVRRRWSRRRLRWRGKPGGMALIDGADLIGAGAELPVVGLVFFGVALLLFAVGAIVLVVPALIFLVELVIVAAVVGVGLVGRVLLGRPWTVEAHRLADGKALEWQVIGWRASNALITTVAAELRSTGVPAGGSPAR